MRSGFRVGRLFGINLYIDWSWVIIFLLVTWNLAAGVFPALHPDWSFELNITLAIVASLLFFISVLAHEMAHSLVARARGLPVGRITLFIFGGVSNIEEEPPTPTTEFLMAVVGPLTSLILGVIFLFAGGALTDGAAASLTEPGQVLANLQPAPTLLFWLGSVNILLGIFNLIPGFPLDGGRLLRSILWATTDNFLKATRWASWAGRAIAWLFIGIGVAMIFGVQIPILGTGFINGLWLIFIGWFLNSAASQSYQRVVIEDLLEGVPVSRLMHTYSSRVHPDMSLEEVVYDYIMGTEERTFPVIEDNQLVGLISIDEVRKIPRNDWNTTSVRQAMIPADQVAVISPAEDASDAFTILAQRDIRQMPVIENGELVGMLRRQDIIRWLRLHSDAFAG